MSKPVIFAIDDEPAVLNAVDRDLRQKYGRDYRILKSDSGTAALDALRQLQQRNETAALFVVDQRMPQMTGLQFLEQAVKIFPESKKILLTAYADTEAAIQSINRVGLDYYLMKPWDPPQEHLYPVLDDLLDEWKMHAQLPYEGIRVVGSLWSPASHQVKEFLSRHQIPFQWLDVDLDPKARVLVQDRDGGALTLPSVFFPDGTVLPAPDLRLLADKVGLATRAALPFYELVIVGAGPAGTSAAVYASSDGIKCVVVEKAAPGGQAGSSPKIENYLGFPAGISGGDLTHRAIAQARRFGTEILTAIQVTRVRAQDQYRVVTLEDGSEISCHALLLATGASFHLLKMPGAAALFVFIGVRPQSQLLDGQALCDEKGYLYTGPDLVRDGKRPPGWPLPRDPMMMETSMPGVFAAGDVRFGTNHRVASAVGEAGVATMMIKQYLKKL